MSISNPVKESLKEIYSIDYVQARLLKNFYYIIFGILVILKIVAVFTTSSDEVNFPFILTFCLVAIQYFLFLKFKNVNFSSNLLLISLYTPMVIETLNKGGIYSDNLLYFLLIPSVCILLMDVKKTIIWTFLTLLFVILLYNLEISATESYLADANFEPFYYFNAIFWLFTLVSAFIITSGVILNRIFRQLEYQKEKLIKQHESLVAVNNKLNKTEQSLRLSNKALEQFAHSTAHDLKQPIRSMTSFAQLSKRRVNKLGIKDNDLGDFLNFIHSSGMQMEKLVDQLMAYAQVNAKSNDEIQEIELNHLIKDICSPIISSKEFPNTTLNINVKELKIKGNPAKVRQLFQNIILNAFKFSSKQPNPRIEIYDLEKEESYWFCIKDNGVGISVENQQEVFQLFNKVHKNTEFEGSGIGLATSKEIVEKYGGKIWIESELHKGCSIFFSIPKSRVTLKNQNPVSA